MIRVTVELIPATGGPPRHLGTAYISNDGTGNKQAGNYRAMFSKARQPKTPWRKGSVEGFPRLRRGAWDLLYLALRSAVGDRYLAVTSSGSPQPKRTTEGKVT